jgi:uncharacterized protein (TIGR00369 family)
MSDSLPDHDASRELMRTRTISWSEPALIGRASRQMNGLDMLRAISRGELPKPPVHSLHGITIASVEIGRVSLRMTPQEVHYNPMSIVHGGVLSTLLDSAMGFSVQSRLPAAAGYTTLDLQVRFVRPVSVATGEISAEGRVVHFGGTVVTAEGEIKDSAGRIMAHATTSCLILRGAREKPAPKA